MMDTWAILSGTVGVQVLGNERSSSPLRSGADDLEGSFPSGFSSYRGGRGIENYLRLPPSTCLVFLGLLPLRVMKRGRKFPAARVTFWGFAVRCFC